MVGVAIVTVDGSSDGNPDDDTGESVASNGDSVAATIGDSVGWTGDSVGSNSTASTGEGVGWNVASGTDGSNVGNASNGCVTCVTCVVNCEGSNDGASEGGTDESMEGRPLGVVLGMSL